MNRIARSIGANVFAQASTVATQLLTVPLLLMAWGPERFGAWIMMATIAAYLSLADLGFTGVALNRMIMCIAADNARSAAVSFQSALLLLVVVGTVLTAAAVPIGLLLGAPVAGWFGLARAEVAPALVMIALQASLQMLAVLLCGVFQSERRYAESTLWMNVARLLEFALVVIGALVFKAGFAVLLGVIAAVRVLLVLVLYLRSRTFAAWSVAGFALASWRELREMLVPAIALLAFSLGGALNLQGIVLLTGTLFGPVAVAHFSAMRTLARVPYQLSQLVNLALAPEIGRLYGEGKAHALRSLYRRATAGCFLLAATSSLALYLAADVICRYWTHGKLQPVEPDFGLLLAAAVVNSLWYTGSLMFTSTNNHVRYAVVYLAANASGLAIALMAGPLLGTAGAALGVLGTEVLLLVALLPRLRGFSREGMAAPRSA